MEKSIVFLVFALTSAVVNADTTYQNNNKSYNSYNNQTNPSYYQGSQPYTSSSKDSSEADQDNPNSAASRQARSKLKCRTEGEKKAQASSASKDRSCPSKDPADEMMNNFEKIAELCAKESQGQMSDEFVDTYIKTFGGPGSGMNPAYMKDQLKAYENAIKELKEKIPKLEEALVNQDSTEAEAKKKAIQEKYKLFQDELNQIAKDYNTAPETEKPKLYTKYHEIHAQKVKFEDENYSFLVGNYSVADKLKYAKVNLAEYEKQQEKLQEMLNQMLATSTSEDDAKKKANRSFVEKKVKEAADSVKSRSGFVDCGFTDIELFGIAMYTASAYRPINAALRGGDPEKVQKLEPLISAINSGLSKIQGYKGKVTRGTDLDSKTLESFCEGCTVEMKAFTSSSVSRPFSGNYQLVIKSKEGAHVDPISMSRGEDEVIFKAGTRFKVLSKVGNRFTLQEVD